jgi:predicted lactoylglutathione lyase
MSTTDTTFEHTSGSEAPAPTINNAGTTPKTPRKLFVNIPVSNVQRSIIFFEALGFTFNTQFTDATSTAMLVGEDAYFMLLNEDRFAGFSKRPSGNPREQTNAMFALSAASREEVDAMVKKAIAAGGTYAADSVDHGFMYGWSFYDLDGYHWEVFWMDPAAIQG